MIYLIKDMSIKAKTVLMEEIENIIESLRAEGKSEEFIGKVVEEYNGSLPVASTSQTGTVGNTLEGTTPAKPYDFKPLSELDQIKRSLKEEGKDDAFISAVEEEYNRTAERDASTTLEDIVGDSDVPVFEETEGVEVEPFELVEERLKKNLPVQDLEKEYSAETANEDLIAANEASQSALKNTISEDEVLQPIIKSVRAGLEEESTGYYEKLSKKYNLTDPNDVKKLDKEFNNWYYGRFNEEAHKNSTYSRRMGIYEDQIGQYANKEGSRIAAAVHEKEIQDNKKEYISEKPKALQLLYNSPIGDFIYNTEISTKFQIPSLAEGFRSTMSYKNLNNLKEIEKTISPEQSYRFLVDEDGKLITPEDNRSYADPNDIAFETREASGQDYLDWLKAKQLDYRGRLVGSVAKSDEYKERLQELHDPASFLNEDGDFDVSKLNYGNIQKLAGDQLPMMAAAIIPGGSVVLEMGELFEDMTTDIASKKFNKPVQDLTEAEILSVLDEGLVDEDLVIDRGLVAGGLDFIAAGKVFKTAKALYRGGLKNGFKNVTNYVTSVGLESGTEAAQGYIKQDAVRSVTGRPIDLRSIKEEAAAGAVFSAIIPLPGGVVNVAKYGVEKLTKDYQKAIVNSIDLESIINHKEETIIPGIQKAVEDGEITPQEARDTLDDLEATEKAAAKLPEDLSPQDKKRSLKVLKEIEEINEKTAGKDLTFFKKEVERKKVLKERLENIAAEATYVENVEEDLLSDTENETREQDAGTQQEGSDRNVLSRRGSDGKALQGDTDNVGTTKTEKGPIGKTQDDTGGLGEASVGKTKPDNARTAGVQELQPGTDKPTQNRRHRDLQSSLGYETKQKGGVSGAYSIPITQTGRFGVQQVPIAIDLQSIYTDKDKITNPQVQALKEIYEKNWGIKTVAIDFDTFNNGSLKGSEGVSFLDKTGAPIIGLNKDGFSKDTPIHEMGHFIIPLIRKNNLALYEAFKDKLLNSEEGKPFRDQLAARKSEGNYATNNAEQDVQELMSISLGQIGYEINKGKDSQSALIKLAEQILNFFKDVLKSLGYDIDSIRSKKPGKLTLGDIANVINAEAKSPGTILKGKFSKEDVARAKIEESSNLTENSVGGFKIKETTTALGGKLIIPEGFKIEELPFQGKEVTERMKEALENDIPSAQSQLGERKEHTSRKRGVQPKKTPEQESSDKRFAGVVEDVKQIQKDAKSLKRAHIKVTQNEDPKRVALAIANAFFGKKGKLNGERLQGVARKIGKAAIPKDHKFKDEKTRRMAEGQIGMRYLDPFIYHSENNPEGWLDLEVEVSRGKRGALDEKFNIIVKKPAALNEFLVGAAFGINVENHSTAQSEPEVYGDDNKNQHGNHQIPRADESVKDDQDPQVKDNINKLNGVGYAINEDILVVFENKLQKLIDEINAKNFTDEKKNAKIKRAKRALALARSLVGRTFYVGNHYDFRGRIIAAIEGLNFQGTKMELALFQQANPKGKPIGAEGLKRLIIDSGDTLGGVEGSSDIDRLNYGLANLPAIVEMTNDLIKNDQWSNETKVDEPHLHASAALELRKALELEDPTTYVTGHVPMEDASSSAIQIWSRHLRLEDVADMVNAGTSLEQGDFYNQLADNTFSKLTTPTEPELETFNRIQPEYDRQRKNIEKTYQQQRKDKNFKKEEGAETPLQQAWREFKEWRADNRKDLDTAFRIYWSLPKRLGKIRKLAKGPGFTRYYMATPLSMTDNMVSDFQGEPLFDGMYWDHASWLVKKLNEEAIKLANPIEIAKEQISLLGEVKGRRGESLTWTAPGGFKVVQNPREAITQGVKWRFPGDNKRVLNRPSRKGADNEILNPTYVVGDGGIKVTGKGGMKSSGPANFIQSGDAGVKQWLLTNTDIDLTQIFDNFGTLLADADQLSIFLRMAYVDLFTPDHVKNLFYENLPEDEAKEMHDKIPYGTMKADDNTIIKNPHTFSAGTFKPKVDVQHLRELNTKEIFETYEDLVSETEGFLLNDKIEEIEEKQKPC